MTHADGHAIARLHRDPPTADYRRAQAFEHDEGATWLDRTMTDQRNTVAQHGFGADVRAAWDRRKHVLTDMGLAMDMGEGGFRAPRDLIQRLEKMDLESTGKALAAGRGRQWQPTVPGNYVTGQLAGCAQQAARRKYR